MARIEFSKGTTQKAVTANATIRKGVANLFSKTFSVVMNVLSSDFEDCKQHNSTLELDTYLTGGEHESRINKLIPLCIERGAVSTAVSPVIRSIRYGIRRKDDFDALVDHYGDIIKVANAVKSYGPLFALHGQLVRVGLLKYESKKERSENTARFAQAARNSVTTNQNVETGIRKLLLLAGMPEVVSTDIAIERIKMHIKSLQVAKAKNIKPTTKPLAWEAMLPQTRAAGAGAGA